MGYPPKQIDERAARRSGLRVIGVIMILLGIAAAAYGFSQLHGGPTPTPDTFNQPMTDATNSGNDFTSLFLVAVGAVVLLAGFGCISVSLNPRDEPVVPGETGRTCRSCGLLNEPGASTCETCGEPLRA